MATTQKTITFGRLKEILDDFNNQVKNSPSFMILHQGKIERFYKQNAARIQELRAKEKALVEKYVQKQEGNPMTEIQEGIEVWKFEEGPDKDNYLYDLKKFLDITFTVHL